jgi:hypothetical protein
MRTTQLAILRADVNPNICMHATSTCVCECVRME